MAVLAENETNSPKTAKATTIERRTWRIIGFSESSVVKVSSAISARARGHTFSAFRGVVSTNVHYDHPILLLEHMIWHEGYHHGQIKLALKLAGHLITDEEAGPLTWRVWMRKQRT